MFDWKEYLTIAEDLGAGRSATASEEARARAAVSRASDAVFCCARDDLVATTELSFKRQDEPNLHQRVADLLRLSVDGRRRDLGKRLVLMRLARNRCDYEYDVRRARELQAEALTHARHAFAKIEGLYR